MQPGMTVGSYRILEQVGLGGMATVFKAYDPGTDRYVAIKIVSPHFANNPEFRERFRREAKSIAMLEHLHIIPVYAFGEEGDTAYLVLRYMDTGTLRDRMNDHPLDFAEAGRLIDQIAGALDYAHRNGVIHRDVKPSNVLVDSEGNTYLTDFGIAKIVEATIELTGTGTAMGTPQYMSPEQCRGDKSLTAATDIYSLGVILYQMLIGRPPFEAETPLAIIQMHLNDPLPPPRQLNPDIPEELERVLLKALAKDPADRHSTAAEFAARLREALRQARPAAATIVEEPVVGEPTAAPATQKAGLVRFWWIGAALVAVVGVGLAFGLARPADPLTLPKPEEPAVGGTSQSSAVAEEVPLAEPNPLRVSLTWPTFIDPAVGNDASSSTSLANIYDTLIFPNADGGVDPWLAESWDISDDGLTYTFNLRDGVNFHDGSDLKASDVVYSYNRLQTIGEGFAFLISDAEVKAVDDSTVEFKLSAPSGLFVPSLVRLYIANEDLVRANTLAEGPYGAEGDFGKEWLLTHDAGSGPYQVAEFPLEEFLLMEKFDDWWNASAFHTDAPASVKFIATTETATVRVLMEEGELEITDQWQTIEALEALDAMDGVSSIAFPGMTSFYYMMNNTKPPLDDVHCRRAISYAFDYDQAVALEWPGTKQMIGPVPQTVGGHNPNVTVYERDLDKAQEELALCQYAGNIANFPIEVVWIAEVPAEEKWALLFQANMADIGISVEVVSNPWLSAVENTSSQETSSHIVTIYVPSALAEAGLMLQHRYHSSTANTWQQNEWLLDADLDARIEDALATVDQDERFAKYADLQDELADLAVSLFIYDWLEKRAVADYVDWNPDLNSPVMGYQIYAAFIGVSPP